MTLQRERILQVADEIEKLPPRNFDMHSWADEVDGCGTVCCIGGHIALHKLSDATATDEAVADWLGIEVELAERLFLPGDVYNVLTLDEMRAAWAATPAQGAAVLRHLADTGEVDWTIPKRMRREASEARRQKKE